MLWLALLMLVMGARADQYCRGLALESGGSRGAYEAGAIAGLVRSLPPQEVMWNIISGVSTGSISTAGASQFPMGDEQAMADSLVNVWLSLNGSASVYESWSGHDLIYSILFEKSMYNPAPLRHMLSTFMTQPPQRNVTVGSTNISSSRFIRFNETLGTDFLEAVMCSAASAAFFPPQEFLGSIWIDGGILLMFDTFEVVERCLEVVEDESLVIVDLIFCTGAELQQLAQGQQWKVTDVYRRASEVRAYDKTMWYAARAMQAYPRAHFRYVIVPSQPLAGGVEPLDFQHSNLVFEVALGQQDAENSVNSAHDPRAIVQRWKQTRYSQVRTFSR